MSRAQREWEATKYCCNQQEAWEIIERMQSREDDSDDDVLLRNYGVQIPITFRPITRVIRREYKKGDQLYREYCPDPIAHVTMAEVEQYNAWVDDGWVYWPIEKIFY